MPSNLPIVFIPGVLCDEALWEGQVKHFAGKRPAQVHVAAQDDNMAGMAHRVLDVAPARFVLCGISMGGYVALEIMRQQPGRVAGLVLADTTARPDTEEQRDRRRDLMALSAQGRFTGVTRRFLGQWLAPDSLKDEAITSTITAMSLRLGRDVYLAQQKSCMDRIDSRPTLKTVACPSCVIVGQMDLVTPPSLGEEMANAIPGAYMEVLENSAHLPPIEKPQAVNGVLDNFLKLV